MRVLAPAKLNLFLRVGPRRADGFHPLVSWMVTIGLFDTLTFERARSPGFTLATDHPDLPAGPANLVVRAAEALAAALADSPTATVGGLSALLAKRIPVGAGLGGGSSDGARTLLALNRLWNLDWPVPRLAELASRFGSDLSFFFHGPSSVCSGRGEQVVPVPRPGCSWAVLVLPPFALSTAEVYRRFDELPAADDADALDQPQALQRLSQWASLPAQLLLPLLSNDLEPAAFSLRPELSGLRAGIEQSIGRIVRMSGSGSSLFTLCDNQPEAEELADRVNETCRVRALPVSVAPDFSDDLNRIAADA